MTKHTKTPPSPAGYPHREAARRRARDPEYAAEARRLAPYEALARIVIRRRGELSLTQAQLARRMGTSHSAISRIEGGQHATSVATLQRLADALQTHLVIGFADEASAGEAVTAPATDRHHAADLIALS